MIYKTYGKTGLSVSAVGFGGMRFDTARSKEENAALLRYAVDKGINWLDTAPGYCDDQSEDIFGLAIQQMTSQRDKFYISTKGMPENCTTAAKAQEAVEKSLKRLRTDYIDFYYVWCIRRWKEYELAMKPGGQYEGLLKCLQQGKIRHLVVSTHLRGPDVQRLLGKMEFEGVLLGVNILNFMYRWQGVQAASELGLGVAAMNPLAGGIIPRHHEQLSFLAGIGKTPTEAALRFCISCPQITVTLVGVTLHEHIDMACRAADSAAIFSKDDIERIRRRLTSSMDKLCTGCGYCMEYCPRNIPISNYMQYYNYKLFDKRSDEKMMELLKEQYEWGLLADRPSDAEDCVRCGRCELACTQHLDIIRRLEEIAVWEKRCSL